jgi:hypothetical protein
VYLYATSADSSGTATDSRGFTVYHEGTVYAFTKCTFRNFCRFR